MEQQVKPLVNRVQASGLITIDLEDFAPKHEMTGFDLKEFLWQGLVLKEKDFREAMKDFDWASIKDQALLVHCSTDAIIPTWAYMLVASHALPFAKEVFQGDQEAYLRNWYSRLFDAMDPEDYLDKRIVVKGCSTSRVPESAYVDLVSRLQPVVKSLMFGEPCSTVPVYKQKKV